MLKSRLPQIAARLDNVIDRGLKDVADDIVADAKDRVPVDSGDLRDSIHAEPAEGGDGYTVLAGDADVFYGHLVEFGTTHTGARPFLVPAGEAQRANIKTRAAAHLRDLI